MKRLALLLLASAAPTPALAQHEGHAEAAEPAAQDPHAGHVMPAPAPAPSPAPASAPAPADPNAGHAAEPVPPVEAPEPDPHAGHVMPGAGESAAEPADPHAGHAMPGVGESAAEPADPHAGHLPSEPMPPPPEALSGPEHAADLFNSPVEMAAARQALLDEHGDVPIHRVLIDRLEAALRDGRDGYAWDVDAWWGGDIDKLWLKSEGEGSLWDSPDEAEVQALWSHAIDPWFDLQLGLRQDLRTGPDRTHLVAGVQGLAPYWFEVEAFAFLSNKGDVTARFEGEYDLRLTQALILQPRAEVDLALQDIPELRVGAGLSTGEIGVRLRYELFPESGPAVVAPYIGVAYERAFGQTADYHRADGESAGGWNLLVGVRTWF